MTRALVLLLLTICVASVSYAAEATQYVDGGVPAGPTQRIETVLDDRQIAVNTLYESRLDALNEQILAAPDYEARMALQSQAQDLKEEWNLASLRTNLEIAAENGDATLEAELRHAIQTLENPEKRQIPAQVIDPVTNKQVEGGAR